MPLNTKISNKSCSLKVSPVLTAVILFAAMAISALAAPASAVAQTGSRLNSNASPETILWLSPPGEISEIRQLLQNGRGEKAVKTARAFVKHLFSSSESSGGIGGAISYRYAALNALCVALSATGELDEAMEHCDRAVGISDNKWQALNSRATVHYLAKRYTQALADYRLALSVTGDSDTATGVLEHNIQLAEDKLAGS